MKTAVIYAFFNRDESARKQLIHFFEKGYRRDAMFYVVINVRRNDSIDENLQVTKLIPKLSNIKVLFRDNTGFDFAAYAYGLKLAIQDERHTDFFFLNTSAVGPIRCGDAWLDKFRALLVGDVKLVGPTICCTTWHAVTKGLVNCLPHVQSYAFLADRECVLYLLKCGIFDHEFSDLLQVVTQQEVAMSTVVLKRGWNITCFVPQYQGIDYRTLDKDPNFSSVNGDILFPGDTCFGHRLPIEDLVFVKGNRGLDITME